MKVVNFIKSKRALKFVIIVVALYVLQAVVGGLAIYFAAIAHTKASLNQIHDRVASSIEFKNGVWDTSKYNTDPEIPGPYRLYVFSNDGFVIDRWRPIAGHQNISNVRRLLEYKTPQTIHTVTDQSWRMYSKPIVDNGAEIGVITASYFSPEEANISRIDQKLQQAVEKINKGVEVKDGAIDVSGVDNQLVAFDIPFQIVDQYNQILLKTNNANSMDRIPDFIDPTFVLRNLRRSSEFRQIQDSKTNESFLVTYRPLVDDQGTEKGVVIIGRTIEPMLYILKVYTLVMALFGVLLLAGSGAWYYYQRRNGNSEQAATTPKQLPNEKVQKIEFLAKECVIKINDHTVSLTYATNQYYLCKALFSAPKRQWETDELIERFGEQHNANSWRKVYDTMVSVNKKAAPFMQQKVIINNNKTYQINPDLLDKIA